MGQVTSTAGSPSTVAQREVVAYCRSPFCAYAHEAVRRLNDAGRAAHRLEDGWPEWRLAHSSPHYPDRNRTPTQGG